MSSPAATAHPGVRRSAWALALVGALALLAVLSVAFGARVVSPGEVWGGLAGSTDGFGEAAVAKRVPRTALALLAGAALAVSGVVMQGVTRNPLADPGILGVNMGAALAVVVGIAHFGLVSATSFVWVAIAGAAVAALVVYAIASLGPGGFHAGAATPLKLALSGAAVSAALASFISAVVLGRNDIASGVRSWQIGGVGGADFASMAAVAPFLAGGLAISLLAAKALNSLALGDELAAGLGERVGLARGLASLGAIVLAGAVTALTGPIGFVGLVVPHVVRLLIGSDHRWLLPLSALAGAVLLTAADIVGRVVARPAEIDVGIVTALVGAPFFIYIVRRQKVREL
ncbi:FecCD family ABC transporter permease [Zhihengliuella salsuginis]|uniref:ABC transporter permease n=1 Tax=Zhihengliuella salsuginis TaxID=578222 RepID=A0ABQ3GBH0_9MICC|nr:iron ABC transporter permease [Zhihengliuella salsuginis]GHD00395.1 ABC transporter permease [Zhihengliuella salsuginis]